MRSAGKILDLSNHSGHLARALSIARPQPRKVTVLGFSRSVEAENNVEATLLSTYVLLRFMISIRRSPAIPLSVTWLTVHSNRQFIEYSETFVLPPQPHFSNTHHRICLRKVLGYDQQNGSHVCVCVSDIGVIFWNPSISFVRWLPAMILQVVCLSRIDSSGLATFEAGEFILYVAPFLGFIHTRFRA